MTSGAEEMPKSLARSHYATRRDWSWAKSHNDPSDQLRKLLELGSGGDKPELGQIGQVVLHRERRVQQAQPNLPDRGAEQARREAELVAEEFVGMLRFQAIGSESLGRKMTLVLSDDGIAAADDGGRKHMAVVGIGKIESRDEVLIALNQTIPRRLVHQVAGALERGPVAMRFVA